MMRDVLDRPTRILIRLALLCVLAPIAFAFIVSSPGRAGFWVLLFGVFFLMVPGLAVASWARTESRRDRAKPRA